MKGIILSLAVILLLVPLASGHGIEKGPVSKSTEALNLIFSTEPNYPVTGRNVSLNLIIEDKKGNLLSDLNAKLELHKQEEAITLDLIEKQEGHYSREYNFKEPGSYEIHLAIDDEDQGIGFDLAVDSFGQSGLLRSGIIALLLLIFIALMVQDLRSSQLLNTKRQ